MKPIILEGHELDYWKEHSQLIKELSEWEEYGRLVLSHKDLFPEFTNKDWDFLRKFLKKKDIHFTKSKKYGTIIYNIKGYDPERAEYVADYFMAYKPKNIEAMMAKRHPQVIRKEYNFIPSNNNNNDYNNNNNNISWKKKKYELNVKVNNTNTKSYAKRATRKMKERGRFTREKKKGE